MSLTTSGNSSTSFEPIPEGSYLAVCNMLIDLGEQYSETYKHISNKVLIGWEIPELIIELEDGPHTRTISQQYTNSLNESANLRAALAAWRGRDFTAKELEAFDLRAILGTSCLINVIHRKGNSGKTYANIQSIMALPKTMTPGKLSENALVFDFDKDDLAKIETFPKWIADLLKRSNTYQNMIAAPVPQTAYTEESDDGQLPF